MNQEFAITLFNLLTLGESEGIKVQFLTPDNLPNVIKLVVKDKNFYVEHWFYDQELILFSASEQILKERILSSIEKIKSWRQARAEH